MSRALTRRALVQAGAALGAAALPPGICRAIGSAPAPTSFDAAAFVADLRAIGCTVYIISREGRGATYGVMSADGFGKDFRALAQRWRTAAEACPDHADQVAAHLLGEVA